jgi:hypothetical protein
MRIWLLLIACAFGQAAYADPLTIDKSTSPDGKYFLTIEPGPLDTGAAVGTAQIREKKSNKVTGTFSWEGFGESPDANTFFVLWNNNDRAFAISSEVTRGYVDCDVYAMVDGKWQKVKLPNYVAQSLKRESVKEGSDKGYERPLVWIKGGVLKIQIYNKAMAYDYWAYLRLIRRHDEASMKLEKLGRKPPSP